MFIRLPQTAVQSVAPDEREQQRPAHVVLNHIKFSNLSALKIGRSFHITVMNSVTVRHYLCGVTQGFVVKADSWLVCVNNVSVQWMKRLKIEVVKTQIVSF